MLVQTCMPICLLKPLSEDDQAGRQTPLLTFFCFLFVIIVFYSFSCLVFVFVSFWCVFLFCYVLFCFGLLCFVLLRFASSCFVLLRPASPCFVLLCCVFVELRCCTTSPPTLSSFYFVGLFCLVLVLFYSVFCLLQSTLFFPCFFSFFFLLFFCCPQIAKRPKLVSLGVAPSPPPPPSRVFLERAECLVEWAFEDVSRRFFCWYRLCWRHGFCFHGSRLAEFGCRPFPC